ncbi:hypothetical protein BX070DRAFT_224747 [Coemansia spiralis]|nr:hypothetical protein BX070DRAFT_224747 [Coemansia spiralis]
MGTDAIPGVLAAFCAATQLAEWLPGDLPTHRHTWVRPTSAQQQEWFAVCRDCLSRLTITAGTQECVDAIGHHLHTTLEHTGRGHTACCRCAHAYDFRLHSPAIQPTLVRALERARAIDHHPAQSTRDLIATVATLLRLVRNARSGDSRPVKTTSPRPRQLLRFDPACTQIFEALGFELRDSAYHPPPDSPTLARAQDELDVWAARAQRKLPDPSVCSFEAADVGALLGTYERRAGASLVAGPAGAYRRLGVPLDAADHLVMWAYRMMASEGVARFDELVSISEARASEELVELVAEERRGGMVTDGETRAALSALFGDPNVDIHKVDDDTICEMARVAHAPKHLRTLAKAKRSDKLLKYADHLHSTPDPWARLPVGLNNTGNTCYLNSILQLLYSITPIRSAIMCLGDAQTWNEQLALGRHDGAQPITKADIEGALRFVELLKELFATLTERRVDAWAPAPDHQLKHYAAVTPSRELAAMLLQADAKAQQQDVDECMAKCVALLVHALPPGPDGSWIHRLLAGRQELVTTGSPATEDFVTLSVNIPQDTADINECLDMFFAPSVVPSAQGEVRREVRIGTAPPVLCVQIQRVQFDTATLKPYKVNAHLRLRRQISLAPYMQFDRTERRELTAKLAAVNQHLGALKTPQIDNGTVVVALDQARALVDGVQAWAGTASELLAGLDTNPLAEAARLSRELGEMREGLCDAQMRWEEEARGLRAELDSAYENIEEPSYTLHAVFIHSGSSPEYGHYWVYIRDYNGETQEVRWLMFNDSEVSVVPEDAIFKDRPTAGEESSNPYYLVYVRSAELESTVGLGL